MNGYIAMVSPFVALNPLPPPHRDVLLRLAVLVCEGQSLGSVFTRFAGELAHAARFDFAALVVRLPQERSARIVGHYPAGLVAPENLRPRPLDHFGLERIDAFPEGFEFRPAAIETMATRAMASNGLTRGWAVSLQGGRGALVVARGDGRPFADDERALLRQAARFLGGAARQEESVEHLSRARQLEAERERHRDEMEQAARLAALGQLVGGVAHELNNPLMAILGFSELLAAEALPGELAEHVDVIRREAQRAGNIVRDLLVLARPATVRHAPVSLRSLLRHLEKLRREEWRRGGIAVSIVVPAEDPPLSGDEHQLMQVLINLVANAERAVEAVAAPRIDISVEVCDGHLWLEVADNGCGMDPPTRARLFEPFFTTRKGSGGTGLGLSLSYTIVQAHHGRIEVDSTPGAGARFRIMLPTEANSTDEPDPGPNDWSPRQARVLVIDDEPSLRDVCRRLVAAIGHTCETASTANEALDRARAEDFDVILCDFRLGPDSAETVLRQLADEAPHLVARTVIATGATTEPGVIELAAEYDLRLIAKPYGMSELREAIDTVFRRAG